MAITVKDIAELVVPFAREDEALTDTIKRLIKIAELAKAHRALERVSQTAPAKEWNGKIARSRKYLDILLK